MKCVSSFLRLISIKERLRLGDKLKWERSLVHDLVAKYTPGRARDGTVHVWVHHSVIGNSFGGNLFVDRSLVCKRGAQGGQTGWAMAQINEATHELVCSAHGAMPISLPVQRRITRAEVWPCHQPPSCPSQERRSSQDSEAVLQGLERGQQ